LPEVRSGSPRVQVAYLVLVGIEMAEGERVDRPDPLADWEYVARKLGLRDRGRADDYVGRSVQE